MKATTHDEGKSSITFQRLKIPGDNWIASLYAADSADTEEIFPEAAP